MKALTPAEWTAYWENGLVTTFGFSAGKNYDGEVAEFWGRELAGQTGHVVDLCCGNGALVWLANDILNPSGPGVRISGIDLADIHPFELLKRDASDFPAVDFVGNTSTESLPYQNASIDVAISQYGIEYSDVDKTLGELDRVLKPTAKIAFIVHSDQSSVVAESRASAEKYRYLLGEGEFYETALKLDAYFNTKKDFAAVRTDPQTVQLLGKLNRASYHAHHMHNGMEGDYTGSQAVVKSYIAFIMKLFDGSSVVNTRLRKGVLEQWHARVTSTLSRIADLESAALSEQELEHLRQCITRRGFKLARDEPFYYGPTRVFYGTALVATRAE